MKKWLTYTLLGGVAFVAVAGAALMVGGIALAERKAHRAVDVPTVALTLPGDEASLARGRYLFASRGCAECHGASGGGRVFAGDGKSLVLKSPNITRGPGGVVANYLAQDWVRTIRHGVKPNGEPAFIMPSEDYARWTDADAAAVAAYAQQLPPVAGEGAQFRLPLPMKALYGWGVIKDAAEKIDHALPAPAPVAEAVTVEHGAYVANMCRGCHGPDLSGGKRAGQPPDWPAPARLAPGPDSVMERYPDAPSFVAMLRSGLRPDGSRIDKAMPFQTLGALSDVDASALHLYLQSLKARAD